MELNEKELRTILSVFWELRKMSYPELNKVFGSVTIDEMYALNEKIDAWYNENVLGKVFDTEYGWYFPGDEIV